MGKSNKKLVKTGRVIAEVLLGIFGAITVLVGFAMLFVNIIVGIILLVLSISSLIFVQYNQSKRKKIKKKLESEEKFEMLSGEINTIDQEFNIGKTFEYGSYELKHTLVFDNINKKFAIGLHDSRKKAWTVRVFRYSDLLDYELNEDGASVQSGKRLATAVGGLTFGVLGAMVGATGSRKNEGVCTSLMVRLLLNDFEEPELRIKFVSEAIKKTSVSYEVAMNDALGLTARLKYIQNNN